jgi:glycosyltransferase involved in cell wall biosynthesis
VDLAFKVKAAGFRVLYQPLSQVIHFEGVSSGTDLNLGMKASQLTNQQKFLQYWQSTLIHYQENGKEISKVKDRVASYRLLVIDAAMLTPNSDAGSLLIYNKMILFRELGFQVTFATSGNLNSSSKDVELMQGSGFEVLYTPYYQSVFDHLMECNDRYDVVMLVRPDVYVENIADVKKYCPSAKVLFHTIDLHFLRLQRESILKKDPKLFEAAIASKEIEIQNMKMSDLTFVVSSEEVKILKEIDQSLALKEFSLILNSSQGVNPFSERNDILFIGNYNHLPNRDAVIFFCEEVMPHIRKLDPKINFRIGGSRMPDEIKKLASKDIIIEGFIENLDLKCNEVKIMVAPLRFGAGVKGKVASAIASGLPVVATTIAAEGMHLEGDKPVVLVADDPQEIANLILSIYQNEESWNFMSQNGLELAKKLWGANATITKLKEEVLDPMGFKVEIRSKSVPLFPYNDV